MDVTSGLPPQGRTQTPSRTAEGARVVLDGAGLDVAGVARLADRAAVPSVPEAAYERAALAWRTARDLAASGRLYGRDTGVGANRTIFVGEEEKAGQDLRLLRSHAGGVGELLPARQVRAMLAVRANQVLAGGSGLQPALARAMVEALRMGVHPAVNAFGGLGTGDLTALAQTGLTLIGERPWLDGERSRPEAGRPAPDGDPAGGPADGSDPAAAVPVPAPVTLDSGDGLALMSSSALTLGQAALVCHDMDVLLRATHAVAALSLAAVGGALEAYAAPAVGVRPYPGARQAAAEVRRLLGAPDRPLVPGARIQDPYGFRAFPQAHGPALDAAGALRTVLDVELNCPSENPLISQDGPEGAPAAYHHGGFFAAPVGLALDHLCLTVLHTARFSAARLGHLGDPGLTGLRPFLADGPAASSGMMILEYSANSALAEIRAAASAPASAGHAVVSHGLEETASFAPQAARQAARATDAYRLVLACELVTAVRALRQSPRQLPSALGVLLDRVGPHLPADAEDRPLTADVAAAAALLPALAQV